MGDDGYGWTDVVGDDSDVEIVMMMMGIMGFWRG